jgi:hypothetical protein
MFERYYTFYLNLILLKTYVCQDKLLDSTRWFKYDWDDLCVNNSQFVPVIFEPPCTSFVGFKVLTAVLGDLNLIHLSCCSTSR